MQRILYTEHVINEEVLRKIIIRKNLTLPNRMRNCKSQNENLTLIRHPEGERSKEQGD